MLSKIEYLKTLDLVKENLVTDILTPDISLKNIRLRPSNVFLMANNNMDRLPVNLNPWIAYLDGLVPGYVTISSVNNTTVSNASTTTPSPTTTAKASSLQA